MPSSTQRAIPSVDKLLQRVHASALPRPIIVATLRRHLESLRTSGNPPPPLDSLVEQLNQAVAALARQRLQPVVNGTGILAHTNLGRAPLSAAAVHALTQVAARYSNLELDLETGERGSRAAYLEASIALATGAPAATVVNNGAAALVLILRHFTAGARKEVLISRGELVQIGGGFRIPDILETSGALLREVGTTNQTTLDDYARALSPATALILRVHRSNFYMDGFVDSPSTADLAGLARQHRETFAPSGLPVVEDLGSGAWIDLTRVAPVEPEPRPQESLTTGADLVCFSGDKLLGGPQAGIIVGRAPLVAALKKDPFFRALRCDKLVFAALQATVESYLHSQSRRDASPPHDIPMMAMMQQPTEALRARAEALLTRLGSVANLVRVEPSQAQIGGGVCPRSFLSSIALAIRPVAPSLESLARRLRQHTPPLLGFISDQAFRLDLRTVFPDQDDVIVRALLHALSTPTSATL